MANKLPLVLMKANLAIVLLMAVAIVASTDGTSAGFFVLMAVYLLYCPAVWRSYCALGRFLASDREGPVGPACIVVFLAGGWTLRTPNRDAQIQVMSTISGRLVEKALAAEGDPAPRLYIIGARVELEAARQVIGALDPYRNETYLCAENTYESVLALEQTGLDPSRTIRIVASPIHLLRCAMLLRSRGRRVSHIRVEARPFYYPRLRLFLPPDVAPQRLQQLFHEMAAIITYIARGRIGRANVFGLRTPRQKEGA